MAVISLIIGLAGLGWCLVPIYKWGILGIGNATGIVVFTAFIIYGMFRKKFVSLRKKLWTRKEGRLWLIACYGTGLIITGLVIAESICMITAQDKDIRPGQTMVVLGSYVRRDGPSLMTASRLDKAYEYLVKYPEMNCVLAGGQGPDEPWSEAEGMADYLIARGIASERLILEDRSTNTRENLLYTKELLSERGIEGSIVIVTNEFHMYRAKRIAGRLDIECSGIGAPSVKGLFAHYFIRELYAILADWFVYS